MTPEIPGKPVSVSLAVPGTCLSTSCIRVTWDAPLVPAHGIYCSGGGTVSTGANPCPLTMGRAREADGGAPITMYTLEWSRTPDFCVIDATTDVPSDARVYIIQNLTPGLTYYVRIYAVNSQGRSEAQSQGASGALMLTAA